jgi:hypothetical protein
MKFYFDPTVYPFDGDFKTSTTTWKELSNQLFRSAAENGFHLVANGTRTPTRRALLCTRFRKCQTTSNSKTPDEHRTSHISSNRRKGSRGPEGISGARRRNSARSQNQGDVCPVRITIGVDASGFYLIGGRGEKRHGYHPKLSTKASPLVSRELTEADKKSLGDYRRAGLSCSGASQILRMSSNVHITPAAVRYHTQLIHYGEKALGNLVPTVNSTTTNRLFDSLQRDKIDHIVLSHRGTAHSNPGLDISNFAPTSTTTEQFLSSMTTEQFLSSMPSNEKVLLDAFVAGHRKSRKIPDNQDMFIAVAWMNASERSLFRKFPYVVKIDITFATNTRGFPLLTITGKTSDNQVFTIVRCWVPNEQGWVFRWLLLHALPTLLGKDIYRINVIISDGDSQEIAQINNLIDVVMTTARRLRCGWHLIDRSWNR